MDGLVDGVAAVRSLPPEPADVRTLPHRDESQLMEAGFRSLTAHVPGFSLGHFEMACISAM
jgi:hypothetical protein